MSIAKRLEYSGVNDWMYSKECNYGLDSIEKCAQQLSVDNSSKLIDYSEGVEELAHSTLHAKTIRIYNNVLDSYDKNFESFINQAEKSGESLSFKDGKPFKYEIYESIPDSSETIAKVIIKNENGKWVKAK